MDANSLLLACFCFFLVATLYSSVGHAGASGYLAVMALLSFEAASIKPTSLVLNCLVSSIASYRYLKAGYFDRKIFIPVVAASFPMAFLGGYLNLPSAQFKVFAGVFLLLSAAALIFRAAIRPSEILRPMKLAPAIVLGAAIGLLSGILGVGGGIFLSPILIIAGWTTVRKASGISALFILINSLTALAGYLTNAKPVDAHIGYWAVAVVLGGLLGSYLGTKKLNNSVIIACLVAVLLTAGLKFLAIG